ncbi:DoxX family protein [Robiginitalea sp. IMCC43444]|uniref:DoxX family protein n=1 Tax=Robiginitalea sp. IMCC43444 TaxID=3459121 RepID=UPI00404370F1
MGRIKTLNKWANAHTYYALDLLRILLGAFLIYKMAIFMSNQQAFSEVIRPFQNWPGSWMIMHYIVGAHFVGGIFIIIGLLTRWAAALQIPILFGAVMANFLGEWHSGEFFLAFGVLLVCLFFLFYGSGKHSVDYYLKMQK